MATSQANRRNNIHGHSGHARRSRLQSHQRVHTMGTYTRAIFVYAGTRRGSSSRRWSYYNMDADRRTMPRRAAVFSTSTVITFKFPISSLIKYIHNMCAYSFDIETLHLHPLQLPHIYRNVKIYTCNIIYGTKNLTTTLVLNNQTQRGW